MRITKAILLPGFAVALAGTVSAQQPSAEPMPESYRQVQLSQLELQRRTLLAMVDSMPERLYRDKVTPIQRDFAQQVQHAAGAVPLVASMTMGLPAAQLPDTAAASGSRAGLRAYVNACYDWATNAVRTQTAADRARTVNLFGNQMPAWQVWEEIHQHTFWTAGQIVANFRKHAMAPPGFGFF